MSLTSNNTYANFYYAANEMSVSKQYGMHAMLHFLRIEYISRNSVVITREIMTKYLR